MSFEHTTQIIANCQPKAISDVELSDWVLTYMLQYPDESKKSIEQQTYKYTIGLHDQEPLYFTNTFLASDVIQVNEDIVTPDHKFLVKRFNHQGYCWVQAQELDQDLDVLFRIDKQQHEAIATLKRLNRKTRVTKIITRDAQPYIAGKGSYLSL